MATAKRVRLRGGQPSRWKRNLLLLALGFAALALAVGWPTLAVSSRAHASYAARVGCVCHFVSGLGLDACKGDLGEGAGAISLRADEEARRVTARYLVFSRQSATYDPAHGCRSEPWGG